MTDTLSKTLQLENMSAIDGKEQADLVIETLEGMREDELFLCFYETVKKEASEISGIGAPSLPRKRKNPNYSILIYLDGVKSTDESYAPATPYEHYKNIYTNALDAIINSIKDRFDQPGFQIFSNIEDLLLKAIKGVDYSSQKEALAETYKGDYDDFVLSSELNLLPCLFKDSDVKNFHDIMKHLKSVKNKCSIIQNVVKIVKIVLTNGATSATPERSFSMARRLKTWQRSTMSQRRFNSLAILSAHKDILDGLSLVDIANDFTEARSSRPPDQEFGVFKDTDL